LAYHADAIWFCRLTTSLMQHGRNNGKKLLAVRICHVCLGCSKTYAAPNLSAQCCSCMISNGAAGANSQARI